jgi:hypothetical protein
VLNRIKKVIRAVAVLEHIGSPAARQFLQVLAEGAPAAHVTREAQAALGRLAGEGIYRRGE